MFAPARAMCDVATVDMTMGSQDIAKLRDAMEHPKNVDLGLKAPDRMPHYDAIVHYVSRGGDPDRPTATEIWVSTDHVDILDPSAVMSHDEAVAYTSALVLAVADSGQAGDRWKALYDVMAAADAALTANTPDPYATRHKISIDLAQRLLTQGFHPAILAANGGGQNSEEDTLFVAVMKQLAPGVAGVTVLPKPAPDMPVYEPLAYYAGWNVDPKYPNQGIVYVNQDHLKANGNDIQKDTAMMDPYLRAFMLATMDGGLAGTDWKSKYDKAAQADASLPASAVDRNVNRRALVAQMESDLRAQFGN